jgi:proteasome lid subunit RPN8/RPN11
LRPEDLLAADKKARAAGLDLIGIFHSHPDCDAYFSKTDLENSCPWYSFVVISVKNGKFDHANSFLPNAEQTDAPKEELIWPKS